MLNLPFATRNGAQKKECSLAVKNYILEKFIFTAQKIAIDIPCGLHNYSTTYILLLIHPACATPPPLGIVYNSSPILGTTNL